MELKGRVALITGASRGLGVRIADALAAEGAHLALAARTEESLIDTARRVERHGGKTLVAPADITDEDSLEALVERTTQELGPIDLLVNNAGIECVGYFEKLDPDLIEDTVETNLTGLMMLTRFVVPGMLERGRGQIVNVASAAGKAARPFGVVYSATKHAVVGFSWGLRAELEGRGVGVSVVCPSYVTGEGMFAEREARAGKVPAALKPVSADAVARAVVRAAVRNQAEVVVGPPLLKASDVFHAISPKAAMWVGRRSGLYRFTKREATGDP
jgi:short-subunit dehydrogenase